MQKEEKNQCSINCPFLALRSFLPNMMPYYCVKYEKFLGVSVAQKVQKCPLCVGKQPELIPYALSLLDTQPRSSELKQAFLKMLPSDQKKVVDLLSRTGIKFSFDAPRSITPVWLSSVVRQQMLKSVKYEKSQERQEFLKLLKWIGEAGTPIEGKTSSLLANLFQVIDASEKGMLLAIMQSPNRLKSFLKQLSKIPQNQSMLKNFRALLYDFDRQREAESVRVVSLHHMMHDLAKAQIAKKKQNTRE